MKAPGTRNLVVATLLALASCGTARGDDAGFVSLFDGKSLAGWTGEPGVWRVEEGAIVGQPPQASGGPTCLIHEKRYKDFVLRAKFKFEHGNSGVHFRCREIRGFDVVGYTAEIGGRGDDETGELRGDARGLLSRVKDRPALEAAYKPGEWAVCEIVARGPRITLTYNGVVTADHEEKPGDGALEGRVALQIFRHPDAKVWFKDVEIKELPPATSSAPAARPSSTGASLAESDFTPLFNGRDFSGWRGDERYWKIENGVIVGRAAGGEPITDSNGTYLATLEKYENYVLRLKFKLSEGNSGVMFRATRRSDTEVVGYEAELKADAKPGELFESSRAYLTRSADRAALDAAYKPGEWNDCEIVANGPQVTIKINGATTAFYEEADATKDLRDGIVALQVSRDVATRVEFKDVRLKKTRLAVMLRN